MYFEYIFPIHQVGAKWIAKIVSWLALHLFTPPSGLGVISAGTSDED